MITRFSTPVKSLVLFVVLMFVVNFAFCTPCAETDSTITATICTGDTFYVGTIAHTQTNTYSDTLVNAGGCDSVVTLNLTVIAPITQTVYDTICYGGSTTFNGHTYSITGSYKDTLTAVSGCDSVVTLQLSVRPVLRDTITQSICHGGAYNFNGTNLSAAGTYKDTLTNGAGCDSILTLILTVTPDVPNSVSHSICQGESYVFYGDTLIFSGVYYDTLVSSTGCDSVIELTLQILPHPVAPYILTSGSVLTSSVGSAYQWYFNGSPLAGDTSASITYTDAGVYQVEITGPNGCSNISGPYHEYAVGINSVAANWDVKLYPNPNNGLFEIAFSDNVVHRLQITDALGSVVMSDENASGTKQYNLADLAGGVYFVRVQENGEVRTIRFVLTK